MHARYAGEVVRAMFEHPDHLFGSPHRLEVGSSDVLAELLDTLRLGELLYGTFELGAPWGIQLPSSEMAHIVAVGRGSARLEVAGSAQSLKLSAGEVAVLPHGGCHNLRDVEGSALYRLGSRDCRQIRAAEPIKLGGTGSCSTVFVGAFRFRPAHRKLSLQRLSSSIHLRSVDPIASPWLTTSVQHLLTESSSSRPGARVIVNRLADVLLVEAIRSFIAGRECPMHRLRALGDRRIGNALALLHETLAQPWTVARMAAAVGLSRSGFAARFSALVGEPPLEYLARWRMTRAAQLLRETDLPMSDVAECVGYRSESAFNKAFRRLEGVTPGVYRRHSNSKPGLRRAGGR